MKQKHRLIAMLLAVLMMTLSVPTMAEETALGHVPERGLILPMTEADVEMGLSLQYEILTPAFDPQLPALTIYYVDGPLLEACIEDYVDPELDEASKAVLIDELREYCSTSVGQMLLLEQDIYDELTADGTDIGILLGAPGAFVLGVNDGHVYVCVDFSEFIQSDDPELTARGVAAAKRATELMAGASFQTIQFAEGEFDPPVSAFPAFTTTDLDGNTVTSDIFAGKDLTVVNIWGTYCGPCIDEMDELAAWSASMPENVQLIGLVSDLYSLEDTETLETAKLICESTGANNYLHIVTNSDFYDLMSTLVGVPTTYFVDSTGAVVGQPIVGANVPGCMAFVEDYLNAQ